MPTYVRGPLMPLSRVCVRMGLLAALVLCCAGCGAGGPRLHPVEGKVLFDNAPPEGAMVVFQPVDGPIGALTPSGVVGADGGFTLSTHPHGDGAPAGQYTVVVSWLPPDARSQENPKNKLPARYADPKTTPLPKVTIGDGPTKLEPILLTKK